ncbi:UDP-N-acetylmuramoyl-L-alanyl-D-glutamate--2,6-diaminopimelate ligase [Rhodopirellula sallentina]|nr:UDP-N-acetylmuramoyl-L-alanyl-D-glutamate--2,6-diaminopimelate ligase [Rhodopirellula sallentina]
MHHSINRSIEFSSNQAHTRWAAPSQGQSASHADNATKTLEKVADPVQRCGRHNETDSDRLTNSSIDADQPTSRHDENQPVSIASLLPNARFFSGSDIEFVSIAESAEQCTPGQLVVYRIGVDCPVELISQALARGAAGILTEQILPAPLPQCIVPDTERAMAEITAKQLIDETGSRPDQRLLTIGIVGESGKTTTALTLAQVLRDIPCRVAYQTDLAQSDGVTTETGEQSLDGAADMIQRISEAADAGAAVTILELDARMLQCGGYDQIGLDMLVIVGHNAARSDFGPSPVDCALERVESDGIVIVSTEDRRSLKAVESSTHRYVTYGVDVDVDADVELKTIDTVDGVLTAMLRHGNRSAMLESLLGQGTLADAIAAAAAVGVATDNPLVQITESVSKIRELPGRCQKVAVADWNVTQAAPSMVLDIAGTPRRVSFVLDAIRQQMASAGPECLPMNVNVKTMSARRAKMWCVLAISDSDDAETLAQYGRLLEAMPDQCVLTCAPNSKEKFLSLSHNVLDGVQDIASMRLVADQDRAITWATQCASSSDTVVVLGGVDRRSARSQREDLQRLEDLMKRLQHESAEASAPVKPAGKSASASTQVPHLKVFNPEG